MSEELKQRKWESCEVDFMPQFMKSGPSLPSFNATYRGNMAGSGNCALRCIRCGDVVPLDVCANCGGDGFNAGLTTENVAGLFCIDCERGFSSWTCQSCGTKNPVSKSLVKPKKGCFIATVVYGSEVAPEVKFLQCYRDQVLLRLRIGRLLVRFYYAVSPLIAQMLRPARPVRTALRIFVLNPMVRVIETRWHRHLTEK